MKKFLSLALALLMVLSSAVAIFADEVEAIAEVEATPYQEAIDLLKALDVFKGNGAGDGAEDAIERYQAALFVARALTGETNDTYWATTNLTPFTDIVDGYAQYAGAITYAYQRQIITGVNDTEYAPAAGIIYQDMLTIATRALGYLGLEYPWGNIRKAEALGLTDGIANVGFEDELTRGEVAQIIVNMLQAPTAKGNILLTDVFGVDVVVITGADNTTYTASSDTVAKKGYVTFRKVSELADGTTYNLPASEFGLEAQLVWKTGAKEATESYDYAVGYSFLVVSRDGYKSLDYAEVCDNDVLYNTGKTNKDEIVAKDGKITVDGIAYKMVSKYSSEIYNGQGTVTGEDEIIVYTPYSTTTIYSNGKFVTNLYGDILDIDNDYKVVLKYNAFNGKYYSVITDADGNVLGYIEATEAEMNKYLVYKNEDIKTYKNFAVTTAVGSNDAYASLEVLDDNNDGTYDRAFYKEYGFGYFAVVPSGDQKIAQIAEYSATNFNVASVVVSVNTKDVEYLGEYAEDFAKGTYDKGAFVLYNFNKQNNILEIVEVLETKTATLSTWNVMENSITLDGEKKEFNYADLKGDQFRCYNFGDNYLANCKAMGEYFYGMYRQLVEYIEFDGEIIYLVPAVKSTGIVIIEEIIGVNAEGEIEAWAYSSGFSGRERITISTIENWYLGYTNIFQTISGLEGIYTAKVDANGKYNLYTSYETLGATLTYAANGYGYFTTAIAANTKVNGCAVAVNHKANANTYYIFYNPVTKAIYTSKGIPATGATVSGDFLWVDANGRIIVLVNGAVDTKFDDAATKGLYWYYSLTNKDVGYISDNIFSNEYKYNMLWDFVKGDNVLGALTVNDILKSGYAYYIRDNKIVSEVNATTVMTGATPFIALQNMFDAYALSDESVRVVNFNLYTAANGNYIDAIKAKLVEAIPELVHNNQVNGIALRNLDLVNGNVSLPLDLTKFGAKETTYKIIGFYNVETGNAVIYNVFAQPAVTCAEIIPGTNPVLFKGPIVTFNVVGQTTVYANRTSACKPNVDTSVTFIEFVKVYEDKHENSTKDCITINFDDAWFNGFKTAMMPKGDTTFTVYGHAGSTVIPVEVTAVWDVDAGEVHLIPKNFELTEALWGALHIEISYNLQHD